MKQKLFTLFLALVTSVGTIFAERVQIGNLYYNLDADNLTAEVTYQEQWSENNYSGLTSADIPSSVTYNSQTYSVTSIGSGAFEYCRSLTSITIPNSVTSIGAWAFAYCRGLTSVTIPNSVTSIGDCAFAGCSGLTSPLYNEHVFAFMPTSYSGDYSIPEGIESIAGGAFQYCRSLTSVTIGNSVTSIGYQAFDECSSLTSVTIPNSVTSIEYAAFSGCSSLKEFEFPNSLKYLVQGVFRGCKNMETLKIPSSVLARGEWFMSDEAYAEYVANGGTLTKEEYCYVDGDRSNERETIAGFVSLYDEIDSNYENPMPNLKTVEAPAWFFDVPEKYWTICPKYLENVIVNRGEMNDNVFGVIKRSYKTLKSLDVSGVSNTTLADEAFRDNYNLTALALPANLTRVSYMAVAGCKNLLAIDIPASVEEIDQSAFEDCRSIQTITFGGVQPSAVAGRSFAPAAASQLRKIGNWAFYNAHELQHLEIPEGVEEIGDAAFYGCTYLEDLVLPASVRAIGDNCFALCSKLAYIVVSSTTPPDIQAKTFYDVKRQIPVYVPDDSVEAYQDDPYWGEFDIQGTSDMQSAVETVSSDASRTIKLIRDGQLLIEHNGRTYNATGAVVK